MPRDPIANSHRVPSIKDAGQALRAQDERRLTSGSPVKMLRAQSWTFGVPLRKACLPGLDVSDQLERMARSRLRGRKLQGEPTHPPSR